MGLAKQKIVQVGGKTEFYSMWHFFSTELNASSLTEK